MSAVIEDIEALFSDVGQVQKELEKFDVKIAVDANEIYELLETHSFRTDRVQFVTTQLLFNLGLTKNFQDEDDDDVIEVSDDSYDGLEDPQFTLSPEYNLVNNSSVLDLSIPDSYSTEGLLPNDSAQENVNSNTNSSVDCSPAVFQVDVIPFRSNVESETVCGSKVSAIEPVSMKDVSKTDCDIIVLDTTGANNSDYVKTKDNSDCNIEPAVSPPSYQNDFMCDVNNNDPNNNIEYEVPPQTEGNQERISVVRETDDSGLEFEDQDDVRCKLLEEARLIHRIVPRQNLEQIYSYLEANLDHKNRVQIVMQEFLTMELAPDSSNVSNIGCMGSNSRINQSSDDLAEQLPCTSSKDNAKTVKRSAVKSNACIDSQSTSTNVKVKKVAEHVSDPQPSTSRAGKGNTPRKSSVDEKLKVDLCSNSVCEESCTNPIESLQVLKKTPPVVDIVEEKLPSESDVKPPDLGEVSSTSTFSIAKCEGTGALCNFEEVGITSTTSLRKETNMEPNIADKPIISETVTCPVVEVFPSSSTESIKFVEDTPIREISKRKLDTVEDEVSPSKRNKIILKQISLNLKGEFTKTEIVLTRNQEKYRSMLMEMFPDADPQYLRQQCQTAETEESLHAVVTRLLECDDYPRRQVTNEVPAEQNGSSSSALSEEDLVERQYQILLAILPNADPTFLLETCEKIGNDEDAIKTFVTNALESKNYPTREDYVKRQEALALQKKYTEQFSIEGFLEILPDPFKYFTQDKKNTSNASVTQHAMAYLKGRYKTIRQQDLKIAFKSNKYNLTLTCQNLDNYFGTLRRHRRSEYECRIPTEVNIPFLQEVAFIQNKKKIEEYLIEKANKKKMAFEKAKEKGELLECGCCFDNEVMAEDMAACNEGHLFCKECIRKGAEVQIGNGKTVFPCLGECEAEFSLKTLQTVLKPSVLSKMLQRKQLEEVKAAGIEDLETCPFCDFATIPAQEDKVFRCLNPDCMRDSCRNCKEPNHIPLRCDEVEKPDEIKMRTYIEDRMTEALVRTCWKCCKKFIKEDGCNKMTCTCGALMCYICRQPVEGYSHFNGQGGDAYHKCPLYSHNDALHVTAVQKEAKKAKEEMAAKNPELKLKHDPTKILPKAGGSKWTHHDYQHLEHLARGLHVLNRANRRGHRLDMARNRELEMAVRVVTGQLGDVPPLRVFGIEHPPPRAHRCIYPLPPPPAHIPQPNPNLIAGHVQVQNPGVHIPLHEQRTVPNKRIAGIQYIVPHMEQVLRGLPVPLPQRPHADLPAQVLPPQAEHPIMTAQPLPPTPPLAHTP